MDREYWSTREYSPLKRCNSARDGSKDRLEVDVLRSRIVSTYSALRQENPQPAFVLSPDPRVNPEAAYPSLRFILPFIL